MPIVKMLHTTISASQSGTHRRCPSASPEDCPRKPRPNSARTAAPAPRSAARESKPCPAPSDTPPPWTGRRTPPAAQRRSRRPSGARPGAPEPVDECLAVQSACRRRRQGRPCPGRLDNHRHQATGPASLLAKLTPPGEHQVGVHVVAPRPNRHRNPGLVALRYNPTLLGIAPATTRSNRACPPGPQILQCFRHLRSCPLGPWWTPPWCPLPIA